MKKKISTKDRFYFSSAIAIFIIRTDADLPFVLIRVPLTDLVYCSEENKPPQD